MIKDTPNNRMRMEEAAETINETNSNIIDTLRILFEDPEISIEDFEDTLLFYLDSLTFVCEACGWNCSTEDMTSDFICNECD